MAGEELVFGAGCVGLIILAIMLLGLAETLQNKRKSASTVNSVRIGAVISFAVGISGIIGLAMQ